jgi:Enterobacteriaceae phage adenine modification enzyme
VTAVQARSLWDVEDVQVMPAVRDMTVGPVAARDVLEFTRRYHYTAMPGNMAWRWGLWHEAVLLGVVTYNLPTRETCASVFGQDHLTHIWHMSRLAMADMAPRNSESRLIGGSLRAITRDFPDIWAVLTYAAADAGHVGFVYQATNAIYTGTGGDTHYYLDRNGHRRGTYATVRGAGRGVTAAIAAELGWTRQQGLAKHRYVYILGTKRQRRDRLALLKLPSLPYPKPPAGEVG